MDEAKGPTARLDSPSGSSGTDPQHVGGLATSLTAVEPRDGEVDRAAGLYIGVIGHRRITNSSVVRQRVRTAVQDILAFTGPADGSPVAVTVVSALAEGADRVVADEILRTPDLACVTLEASLPFPEEEYVKDFQTNESKAEFGRLLDCAGPRKRTPPFTFESREEAYEWAGRDVVDRCDVLIAVLSKRHGHGRGGTAETYEYARSRQIAVVVIDPDATHSHDIVWPGRSTRLEKESDTRLREFFKPHSTVLENRLKDDPSGWLRSQVADELDAIVPLHQMAVRAFQPFMYADTMSRRWHRTYWFLSGAIFVFAAVALGLVAFTAIYEPSFGPLLIWVEICLLVVVGVLAFFSRNHPLQERWISYRYLAERLRSMFFCSLVSSEGNEPRETPDVMSDPAEQWIRQALQSTRQSFPRIVLPDKAARLAAAYLAETWIDDQIDYHVKASRKHQRDGERLHHLTWGLFFLAVALAFFHLLYHPHSGSVDWLEQLILLLAIVVPAAGAACHGIAQQRDHTRQALESVETLRLLRPLRRQVAAASDLATLKDLTEEVSGVMRRENGTWFGVTRVHGVEVTS